MAPQPKHAIEYAALRGMAGLCNALPYRGALAVAWLSARIGFLLSPARVREAERRMRQVFGGRFTSREMRCIAWQSWRNMAFNAAETMRVSKTTPEWLRSVADCESGMAALKAHCDTGRGAVLAVPHMGNWELAAAFCHIHGIPLFGIAGRQRNPLVDAYLSRLRAKHGMDTVMRGDGTMKDVLRRLKAGKVLAILPDVRMPVEGVRVPFLSAEPNLGAGMALLARHAGVPIVPGIVRREGWTRHVLRGFPPIWPDKSLDKNEDVRRMTAAVMKIEEDAIRADPGQWFWFNRRWVLEPIEERNGR